MRKNNQTLFHNFCEALCYYLEYVLFKPKSKATKLLDIEFMTITVLHNHIILCLLHKVHLKANPQTETCVCVFQTLLINSMPCHMHDKPLNKTVCTFTVTCHTDVALDKAAG